MKSFSRLFIVSTLLVTLGSVSYGEEEASGSPMDPAMVEKIKKLTSPSEAHEVLAPFEGSWSYTGTFWMAPGGPGQEMTGKADMSLVHDGRFLKQEFEGPWMGENFQGLGFTGYDNVKEEYVSTWMDNMSTGIMTVTGQYDQETKTLKLSGANSCPMTGEKTRFSRSEWSLIDSDHSTYRSYMAGPDGGEYKAMEISYSRVP